MELGGVAQTDRITKTAGVCGGDACIRGHRIPVWAVINYRRLGDGWGDILRAYPTLSQTDLEAAWQYYQNNREEIDRAIEENEEGEEGLVAE